MIIYKMIKYLKSDLWRQLEKHCIDEQNCFIYSEAYENIEQHTDIMTKHIGYIVKVNV